MPWAVRRLVRGCAGGIAHTLGDAGARGETMGADAARRRFAWMPWAKSVKSVSASPSGAPMYEGRKDTVEAGGRRWVDEYKWMFERNRTLAAALRAEKAYFEKVRTAFATSEEAYMQEMRGAEGVSGTHFPERVGDFVYFVEDVPERPLVYKRRRVADPQHEEVVLDLGEVGGADDAVGIKALVVSPDHRLAAFLRTARNAAGGFVLSIRDIAAGKRVGEGPEVPASSVAFSHDSQFVVYARPDDAGAPREVFVHEIGNAHSQDVCVHIEDCEGCVVEVAGSKDHAFVIINSNSRSSSEVHLLDAARPVSDPALVQGRTAGLEYFVQHHRGRLAILTNAGGAEDYAVMVADVARPGQEAWRPLVPQRPGVSVEDMDLIGSCLVLMERRDGRPGVSLLDMDAASPAPLDLPLPAWAASVRGGANLGKTHLRLVLASPVHPDTPVDIDLARCFRDPAYRLSIRELPAPDSQGLEWIASHAVSSDGVRVPITVARKAGVRGVDAPGCIAEVYGAYGHSLHADHRPEWGPMLQRGWVLAQLHVRGGGEKGRGWHRAGREGNKGTSVSDAIACLEHLQTAGVAPAGRVVLRAESAGGVVAGSVLNARPALVAGVVAQCPFVDVLGSMALRRGLLELLERDEWGDPATPEGIRSIMACCPYWNLPSSPTTRRDAEGRLGQPWPPVLVTGGLLDEHVDVSGILRWVARARACATDGDAHGGPVLFDFRDDRGHVGEQDMAPVQDVAREASFAEWVVAGRVMGQLDSR